VARLGFVVLGAPDLDAATEFYETIGSLTRTETREDEVFLSGGAEHHWVRLVRSSRRGLVRLGYQLCQGVDRQELAASLVASGAEILEAGSLTADRVDGALRFRDPDGLEIELYREQVVLPRPVRGRYIELTAPLHAVCLVRDPVASADFYETTLGFAVSDWIERSAVFMRCTNGYHHSIGAFENVERAGSIDHLCILVPRIDDVAIARNLAIAAGIERRQDLVRHAASGSISTYIRDEHTDGWLEFCTDHEIVQEGRAQRTLPRSATTGDVWEVDSLRAGQSLEVALGVERLWR
jgi:catechol-2,3-dioxygenase